MQHSTSGVALVFPELIILRLEAGKQLFFYRRACCSESGPALASAAASTICVSGFAGSLEHKLAAIDLLLVLGTSHDAFESRAEPRQSNLACCIPLATAHWTLQNSPASDTALFGIGASQASHFITLA